MTVCLPLPSSSLLSSFFFLVIFFIPSYYCFHSTAPHDGNFLNDPWYYKLAIGCAVIGFCLGTMELLRVLGTFLVLSLLSPSLPDPLPSSPLLLSLLVCHLLLVSWYRTSCWMSSQHHGSAERVWYIPPLPLHFSSLPPFFPSFPSPLPFFSFSFCSFY